MASERGAKARLCTSFTKRFSLEPFYSGGAVAVTSDAAWLATTFGSDVHIVESLTSRILHKIRGDGEDVQSLTLARDDTFLITASRSLSLHFYALPEMDHVRTIPKAHEAPVALMAVDPTSSLVATGSADGSVKVWDIRKGYCTHVFRGHGGVISALCWHVEKRASAKEPRALLITGCVDGKVRVWNLHGHTKAMQAKPSAVLNAHAGVVRGLGISPDGGTIVSGARDQTLVFWDAKDGQWQRRDIQLVHERIEALHFVPHTPYFITVGAKGHLRVWNVRGQAMAEQAVQDADDGEEEDELHGLVDALIASSSHTIVTVSATQDLAFFTLRDATPVQTRQLVGYNDEVVDLALVHDQYLAVASNNTQLRIYKLDTHDHDHDVALVDGHSDMVLSLDTSKGNGWLASGSKDHTARIWARVSEQRNGWVCLGVCEGHAESVGTVAFSRKPWEEAPFVATASQDRTIKVWDLSTLSLESRDEKLSSLLTLKVHDKDINAIDIAPNNQLVISGSQDRTVRVFRLNYTPPKKGSKAAASLDALATCRGHKRGVWSVQFSPAEQAFASASSDQTVRMWSLRDFSCVRVFEGHTGSVLRLQYMPSGAQIVSSANDGLVKVWNVRDEECAVTLDAHEDKIWALAVRGATETEPLQVVSGAADSTITVWDDATAAVEAERAAAVKEAVEKEQEFTNLVRLKDYRNAIALAFQMNQPRRLLQLFTQVAASRPDDGAASLDALLRDALGEGNVEPSSITGLAAVDDILRDLPRPHMVQLLLYVRDWNTSARTSPIAQLILHAIVRQWDAVAILDAMDEARKDPAMHGITPLQLLESLAPYTQRHYARVDRMLVESAMLDYTLQAMDHLHGIDSL